jgi:hypothetical protein
LSSIEYNMKPFSLIIILIENHKANKLIQIIENDIQPNFNIFSCGVWYYFKGRPPVKMVDFFMVRWLPLYRLLTVLETLLRHSP